MNWPDIRKERVISNINRLRSVYYSKSTEIFFQRPVLSATLEFDFRHFPVEPFAGRGPQNAVMTAPIVGDDSGGAQRLTGRDASQFALVHLHVGNLEVPELSQKRRRNDLARCQQKDVTLVVDGGLQSRAHAQPRGVDETK